MYPPTQRAVLSSLRPLIIIRKDLFKVSSTDGAILYTVLLLRLQGEQWWILWQWKNNNTEVNICGIENIQYLLADIIIGCHYSKINSIITLTTRDVLILFSILEKIEALEKLQAPIMRTTEKWGKISITSWSVRMKHRGAERATQQHRPRSAFKDLFPDKDGNHRNDV